MANYGLQHWTNPSETKFGSLKVALAGMEYYYEANVRTKPLLIQQNSIDNETKTLEGGQSIRAANTHRK